MDASDVLGLLRRSGLLDPLRGSAVAAGLARWGPSLAAGTMAGALRTPFAAAVIDERGRLTWSQLDRRTTRLARGIHGVGVGRGKTVGILCRNGSGFVVAAVAAAKAGLTPVLLNTGSSAAQLEEVLEREAVDLLLADDDRADELSTITFDGRIVSVSSFDRLEAAGRRRVDPLVPKVAAPVLMTSGTTGTPKGARRSVRSGSAGAGVGILGLVPYRSDDVFVVPAPLFHAWGFSNLTLALTLGATTVAVDRFTPSAVVDAVAEAVDRPLGFEVLNVGRGQPVLLDDFIAELVTVAGKEPNLVPSPRPDTEMLSTFAKTDRLRELLGAEPTVSVGDGVARLWDWWQRYLVEAGP